MKAFTFASEKTEHSFQAHIKFYLDLMLDFKTTDLRSCSFTSILNVQKSLKTLKYLNVLDVH